ncbi:AAA family ATPase [Acetonema longum]|uniref:Nuclease SbcCD subunit C n=1 Tax=Acetonema longum DSM 6540 TaxID=1009370 RepID=F7NKE9_9FIRM|nr:SMC family ATPase [Acetonema longum]EGO63590.1 hypothetical protein ALO_12811 [Acetonema longum DSM 6540]
MIPLRIKIQNLGAIPQADIDLTSVGLCSLVGPNGAGKSTALTWAPLFALYGETKNGCSVDDLVRRGTTEMAVEFDFEHHGDTYKVLRTRSTKGRGKSTLELQKQAGDIWVSESGASIAETQEKINRLLGLDANTMVSSSMILQGKSGEFTAKSKGERKAILAQILQLDQYGDLQEKARAKAAVLKAEIDKVNNQIEVLNGRLTGMEETEADYQAAKVELDILAAAVAIDEIELQKADAELARVNARVEQIDKLFAEADTIRADVIRKTQDRDGYLKRIESAKKILDQESEITARVAEHEQVKESITVLKTKQQRYGQVLSELSKAKTDMLEVDAAVAKVASQILSVKTLLTNTETLKTAAAEYDLLADKLTKLDQLHSQYVELGRQKAETNAKLLVAKNELTSKQNKLKMQIENCAVAATMLQDCECVDIEKANCKFLANAKQASADQVQFQADLDALKSDDVDMYADELLLMDEQIQTLGYSPEEHSKSRTESMRLKPLADQYAQLSGKTELLVTLSETEKGHWERKSSLEAKVAELQAEHDSLLKELSGLSAMQDKLQRLEIWVNLQQQIPAAREILNTTQQLADRLGTEITAGTTKADELTEEYLSTVSGVKDEQKTAQERSEELRRGVTLKRGQENALHAKIGALETKIADMQMAGEERKRLVAELEPQTKKLVRWQTLVKAFGKDGIPALIIENAVPELERIANEILGQMSAGKHHLRFETQRELKSREGVAEALDIIVGDWSGERPYETFSGGEQLRIDLAIRFALSELLARRAGSKVEWVVIDEALSNQDAKHRQMVVDAIKNVADRFKKVIVITHDPELMDAFGQSIQFSIKEDNTREVMVA